MKTEKFYTVKTLAERLAVKPLTIYRLLKDGKLSAVKIGRSIRFDPDEIDVFLESVKVRPGGLKGNKTEGIS